MTSTIKNDDGSNVSYTSQAQVGVAAETDAALAAGATSKQTGPWGSKDVQEQSDADGSASGKVYASRAGDPVLSPTVPAKTADASESAPPKFLETLLNPDEQTTLNNNYNNTVESALDEEVTKNQLNTKQASFLELAFFHPEVAAQADPSVQDMLAEMRGKVADKLQKAGIELPADYQPDSGFVDDALNTAYDATVAEEISQRTGGDLAAARKLTTLHYNPSLGSAADRATMSEIEETALNKLKADYGLTTLPTGVPAIDTEGFNGMVSSNYRGNVETLINGRTDLTAAQKTSLRAFLADPSAAGIPDGIKTIAADIKRQALSAVQQEYGLPPAWAPTGPDLWVGSRVGLDAVLYLKSMNDVAVRTANALPVNSQERMTITNFLKMIGQAISALEKQLYQMQSADSQRAQQTAKGQQDSQETKIAAHKKALDDEKVQQDDINKKKAKSDKMQDIMKFVGPIVLAISVAVTLLSLGSLGPAAIALSVTLLSLSVAEQAGAAGITKKAIDALGKTVLGGALNALTGGLIDTKITDFIGTVILLVGVTLLCGAGESGSLADGVMMGVQVFGSSNVVAESAQNLGGMSPDQAAMVGLYVTIAVTVAASIGAAAYSYAKKGEAAEKLMEKLSQSQAELQAAEVKVSQLLIGGASKFEVFKACTMVEIKQLAMMMAQARAFGGNLTALETNLKRILTIGQTANAAVGLSNAKYQYDISMSEGEVAKIRALAEAKDAILQKAMDDIKALIDQLLNIVNSFGSWIASLEEFQGHKYKTTGDATTSLINASRG